MVENLTLRGDGILTGVAEKPGAGLKMIRSSEGLSSWKHFFKELTASFNAPFQSDWDNATGNLLWKEWGKL